MADIYPHQVIISYEKRDGEKNLCKIFMFQTQMKQIVKEEELVSYNQQY